MVGAVDIGWKIEGTIEDGKLVRIEVKNFKSRLADGKPIVYAMKDGIPHRETATFADILRDLLRRNPGLTKDKFEEVARKAGFRRGTIRDFIEKGIISGQLQYEKRRLSVKVKNDETSAAQLLFDDGEHLDSITIEEQQVVSSGVWVS
jgi:hypothetical protein